MIGKFLNLFYILTILLLLTPSISNAETHIKATDFMKVGVNHFNWTKEYSPYILDEYITVPKNKKLTINGGVVVTSDPLTYDRGLSGMTIEGELNVSGSKEDKVTFLKLDNIFINYATTSIVGAVFDKSYIESNGAHIYMKYVKMLHNDISMTLKKSVANIEDSEFVENNTAIESNYSGPIYQVYRDDDLEFGVGGIGNGTGEDTVDLNQNIIEVSNSIIENNVHSIINRTINTIHAEDNWWGNVSGPGSTISGLVDYEPWKKERPHEAPTCCSSVLFLPGFEASRLYIDESSLLGTSTNNLWEPNRKDDVRKLFYNDEEKPIYGSIYTNDVIGRLYGVKGIYRKFIATMDGMVADKKIKEWLPFAYDWRKSVSDVVDNSTDYSNSLKKSLVDTATLLASSSITKKITIVSHSNGGLVAKMLGVELEKIGRSNMVDKVILVATPELGTPEAILEILHGAKETFVGKAIMPSFISRALGVSIPGAYGLLPSAAFFDKFIEPVIKFNSTTIKSMDFSKYGKEIDSYESFISFLTAGQGDRLQPEEKDIISPSVLSKSFINLSENIHRVIDNWNFPSAVKVLSIIGWGTPTIKSIEYEKNNIIGNETPEGDGTVLSLSAKNMSGMKVYFNQATALESKNNRTVHSDILESDSVVSTLKSAILSESTTTNIITLPLQKYMSYEKPDIKDYPNLSFLKVSIHSPVDIDIYNQDGEHLGLIPNPKYGDEGFPILDDTIGGQYRYFGDEKYITLPGNGVYNIKLRGTGFGIFTMNIDKYVGDMVLVASSTYKDLPVTPLMVASTSIDALNTSPILNIDADGNGKVDIQTKPSEIFDPNIYLDNIEIIIRSFNLDKSLENRYIDRIEKIRKFIDKEKNDKVIKLIKKSVENTDDKHIYSLNMTKLQKMTIVSMFDDLLQRIEDEYKNS